MNVHKPIQKRCRLAGGALLALLAGCQAFMDSADREVYRLIETRQQAAIGETSDVRLDSQAPEFQSRAEPYAFVPHPIDSRVPEEFTHATSRPAIESQPAPDAAAPASQPAEDRKQLTLEESLEIAMKHAREFQNAKEDLYIAALNLTLERHLWTPQFVGDITSRYINEGQITDFDQTLESVARVGFDQRLPFGGQVTAQVLGTLMRDLTDHVTEGESGAILLAADVPLLRGAGRVAYESRYQAERDLIYAVRAFERFRRTLVVDISGDFFNLQRLRQQIVNAEENEEAAARDVSKAEAFWRTGRTDRLDVQRARQVLLDAINTRVDAVANYQTTLDAFKVRLGLPTETPLDVVLPPETSDAQPDAAGPLHAETLEQALRMPDVSEDQAVQAAWTYRLDLLNDLDRIDDARRGIKIAENDLLPDLNAFGSVQMDTNPDKPSTMAYNSERTTWRGGLSLELPLDRKEERNALRRSHITLQRAERNHDLAREQVRLQVRRAMRRVRQQGESLQIQTLNRDLALERRRFARMSFDLGKVGNRDVVEAQNALLSAQNRLAEAQASFRLAILEFRLDSGTLRVDDRGRWPTRMAGAVATP